MQGLGMGLLLEEHRGEIATAWKRAVTTELGAADAALAYAVAPLLREMALTLRGEPVRAPRAGDGHTRCAVLVRSSADPGRLAREFKLLHRAIWEVLRIQGNPISQDERRAADEWIDEALAVALDRLERVRLRLEAFERGPLVIPPRPPQAPSGALKPPPLPVARPVEPANGASHDAPHLVAAPSNGETR